MAHVAIDCRNFNAVSDSLKDRIFKSLKAPHLVPFKKKEFAFDAPLVIEGYGNLAKPDRGGELMPQECWSLENYMINPVICRDHCWSKLVGGAESVAAKPEGLFIRAIIGDPSSGFGLTEDQIETRCLVAQGFLKTFSVGFIPWEMTYDEENDLIVYGKAELLEVSLVTVPMQQESLFNVVKSMLLKNDPIVIGGSKVASEDTGTPGDGTKPGEGKPEDEKPLFEIVNKMYAELQNNTKLCADMHSKVCGSGDKPKELSDAEAMIKDLTDKVEQLTTELNAVKAEKEEIEKSAEKLLALVENK